MKYLLLFSFLFCSLLRAFTPGIYSGTISGATAGWWAFLIESNGTAHVIVWDTLYEEAYGEIDDTINITGNTFSYYLPGSGLYTGQINNGQISGHDANSLIFLNGSLSSMTGPFQNYDGIYVGNFTGSTKGVISLMFDANGNAWYYLETLDFRYDIGKGMISSNGSISLNSLTGSRYTGNINLYTLTGTVRGNDETVNFALVRRTAISESTTPFTSMSRESGYARHTQAGWFDDRSYPWVYSYTMNDWMWVHPSSNETAITYWAKKTGWGWWQLNYGPWCYSYSQGWVQF